MRVIIYCFSGTGNTRLACDTLAAELRSCGAETDVCMLRTDNSPPPPVGYDRIVIAYPVHAFNAPAPVLKFLKKLPEGRLQSVFLLRTSGEPLKMNHAAGVLPKRILKKRKYVVRGEIHYVMPYNIIFKHSEGMASRMKLVMERRASADARAIVAGQGSLERVNALRRLGAFFLRIEHPAMPLIGRTFKTAKTCVGCGICEKKCPQGNIKIVDGKPKFGGNCAGCMSCAFSCPKDALRISLLNGWRVNGEYSFDETPAADGEICRYCRKNYLRYFHEFEDN